jgi:hypothetical protein
MITKDEIGVVTIPLDKKHDLEDGHLVRITDVKGMNEVNDKLFRVKVMYITVIYIYLY